jgi:hypothetical protein
MLTVEFRGGVKKLLEVARQKRTAIMCGGTVLAVPSAACQ